MTASTTTDEVESGRPAASARRLSSAQGVRLFDVLASPEAQVRTRAAWTDLDGELSVDDLAAAWSDVLDRHAALRSVVVWQDRPEPLQQLASPPASGPPPLVRACRPGRRDAEIDALVHDLSSALEPDRAPTARVGAVRCDPGHVLVVVGNAVIVDQASVELVLAELVAGYQGRLHAIAAKPPPARAFNDYLDWLAARDPTEWERHWRTELAGLTEPTRFGEAIWAEPSADGPQVVEETLDPGTASRLRAAIDGGISGTDLIRAAWAIVLSRWARREDVVFGGRVTGPPVALSDAVVVGVMTDEAPVRATVPRHADLRSWFAAFGARRSDDLERAPSGTIRRWSSIPARLPLFESAVGFRPSSTGLSPAWDPVEAHLVVELELGPRPGRLWFRSQRGALDRTGVARVAADLGRALDALVSDDETTIGAVALAADDERLRGTLEVLPAPDAPAVEPVRPATAAGHQPSAAPRTPEEKVLAEIWSAVLEVEVTDVHADFLELGGDSVQALQIVARANERGLAITTEDLFETLTVGSLAGVATTRMSAATDDVEPIDHPLLRTGKQEQAAVAERVGDGLEEMYGLTPTQQGILFHSLDEPSIYVAQVAVLTRRPFDPIAFERAVREVHARHAALRTGFLWEGLSEPVQFVRRHVEPRIDLMDWSGIEEDERQARTAAFLAEDRARGFDLGEAPLIRFIAISEGASATRVACTMHHIILDGWSAALVLQEVAARYDAARDGSTLALPAPRPFRDFLAWLDRCDDDAAERHWRAALKDVAGPTPLGVDGIHPERGHAARTTVVDPELSAALASSARRTGVTLNTFVQGAWALLLARYSGHDDVVFGVTVSGRPPGLAGVESMVGLFINTVPLHVEVPDSVAASAWLQELQASQVRGRAFEHTPVSRIQRWSDVPAGTPLFESAVVFRNHPGADPAGIGRPVGQAQLTMPSSYPFGIGAHVDAQDRLVVSLLHDRARLDVATADRAMSHFLHILGALASRPDQPLGSVDLVDETGDRVVRGGAGPIVRRPAGATVHGLIEEQAARTPDATAVAFLDEALSYGALDARSNRLAHHLVACGVQVGDVVGISLERSMDLVVGIIAIMKAGAAYLPLDPSYPAERLVFMVRDAAPRLVVTSTATVAGVRAGGAPALCLDTVREALAACPEGPVDVEVHERHPAYVIYTSGSTGAPKGVVVEHRSACNTALVVVGMFGIDSSTRVLQFSPVSFDASFAEIAGALTGGARLCVRPSDDLALNTIRRHDVTVAVVPPSLLTALDPAAFPTLEIVIAAGEACPPDLAARWRTAGVRFFNGYGPTEASVCPTFHEVTDVDAGARSIPVGRPAPNYRVHVVDRRGRPAPIGVPGEIVVGGMGVARGYHGRPGLTADRFVPDPFGPEPGGRLYRTGDRGRWLPDGALEFLGRLDEQLKVRGHRVEPAEIEHAIRMLDAVNDAAVNSRGESSAAQLVAYVVTRAEVGVGELRRHLSDRLPDYMVPSVFVTVDALPRTPSGKLDRRALPAPGAPTASTRYAPPETDVEAILCTIIGQVLERERVGRHDDFFELGGNSIQTLQLVARATGRGLALRPRDVFDHPTAAALASAVEGRPPPSVSAEVASAPTISDADRDAVRAAIDGAVDEIWRLGPTQLGMLFHCLAEANTELYIAQVTVPLPGDLDVAAFERAVATVLDRHAVLRTTFVWNGVAEPVQVVLGAPPSPVHQLDLRDVPRDRRAEFVAAALEDDRRRVSALDRGPLLRFAVIRDAGPSTRLACTVHHLVIDAWSAAVLLAELRHCYECERRAVAHELPPAPSYRAFLDWRAAEDEPALERHWRGVLDGIPGPTRLRPDPIGTAVGHEVLDVPVDGRLRAALAAAARRHKVTVATIAQAAWAMVVGLWSGSDDVLYGLTVSGRPPELEGVERMIGLFINTVPVRVRLDRRRPLGEWLVGLHAAHADQVGVEHTPLSSIQRWAGLPAGTPLFDSIMVFHDPQTGARDGAGLPIFSSPNNYPLTLDVEVGDEAVALYMTFQRRWFDRATVERLAGHLRRALTELVADTSRTIGSISLLSDEERHAVTAGANGAPSTVPPTTVVALIEEQVAKSPHAPAATCGGDAATYAQLDIRANRFARYLRSRGVVSGTTVGVLAGRDLDLLVALLAVLKAGGAYVPLDPTYPDERLSYMCRDAGIRLLLVSATTTAVAPDVDVAVVPLDDPTLWSDEVGEPPTPAPGDRDLAYIIYTSGSTGSPKGVMVEHGGVANYLRYAADAYCTGTGWGAPVVSSVAYDLTVPSLYGPLVRGDTVTIIPDEQAREALGAALVERPGARFVKLTPTHLKVIASQVTDEDVPTLASTLVIGGESLFAHDVARWQEVAPDAVLLNEYGPTEGSVANIVHRISAADTARPGAPVPIGRAIPDTTAYVLDGHGAPVPVGVTGELHIGGRCVARGYLGKPGLTADRFIPDPFAPRPGARLYRTGDVARWRDDGTLECLGRIDDQVKLRGHRIEVGEVEAALRAHPAVRESAVVVHADEHGERLVAFVVVTDGAEPDELRSHLARRLPAYMIPAAFVTVDAIPQMPHGKLDRAALLRGYEHQDLLGLYASPTQEAEAVLAEIWAEVLGVERVGVLDDFFLLGGDSIHSLQIVSRASRRGYQVTTRDVFAHPTVRALAATAVPIGDGTHSEIVGPTGLLPAQLALLDGGVDAAQHHVVSAMLGVEDDVDVDALAEAVRTVAHHHDGLRLRVWTGDGGTRAEILPPADAPIELEIVELGNTNLGEVATDVRASLDVEYGPMARMVLFLRDGTPDRFFLVMHHLVSDVVSSLVVLDDIRGAYEQRRSGAAVSMPPKSASLPMVAEAYARAASSPEVTAELAVWQHALRDVEPLPVDRPGGERTWAAAATTLVELDASDTRALLDDVTRVARVTPEEVLLTALVDALAPWTGRRTLHVVVEHHGRQEPIENLDVSRTIGWFTAAFPVQLSVEEGTDPPGALRTAKEQLRAIPRGGIGYGLLRWSGPPEARSALADLPLPDLLFNYLGGREAVAVSPFTFARDLSTDHIRPRPNRPESVRRAPRPELLTVTPYVLGGRLTVAWTYDATSLERRTVERLAGAHRDALLAVVSHQWSDTDASHTLTPSDFPLADIDDDALAAIAGTRRRRTSREID
jgi:amino acid adenylation domain-containing protein/non-ribosomal peptide synthase protein (TIGR01720 family)